MGFIRKYRQEILFSIVLVILYFLTRLLTLLQFPIFTDEAIYLRWAQIAGNDANWRFISLTDGKQPLFIWCVMIVMRFIDDPLAAGRFVSVLAGFFSMTGLFLLGREVFKDARVGLIAAALYLVSPFSLVYDRMALYDSLVGTFAVFGLYFTVLLVRRLRLDVALLMGFVTGAAVLNKTNGFFTIYLLPLAILLLDLRKKERVNRILRFGCLALLVVFLTYGFYAILRLSPYFYIIEEKNAVFVYPLREWLTHPFLKFGENLSALIDWYVRYVGVPQTVFVIGAYFVSQKFLREKVLLLLWFILPFMGLAFMGNQIYPRYIFPMTLSLLPLTAYTVVVLSERLKKRYALILLFLVTASYSVFVFGSVLRDPGASFIPQSDKGQYITAWPAGVGIKESVAFFEREAAKGEIFLATEGTFGLLPYAYEIYLVDHPNVTIKGYWPIHDTPPEELVEIARAKPVYIVFYQDCPTCSGTGLAPASWPVTNVFQIEKPQSGTYMTIYRFIAE